MLESESCYPEFSFKVAPEGVKVEEFWSGDWEESFDERHSARKLNVWKSGNVLVERRKNKNGAKSGSRKPTSLGIAHT